MIETNKVMPKPYKQISNEISNSELSQSNHALTNLSQIANNEKQSGVIKKSQYANRRSTRSTVHGIEDDAPLNKSDSYLHSRCRFYLTIIWLAICHYTVGLNQAFIASFLLTISNNSNFNFDKEEFAVKISLCSSFFFLGIAISSFTLNLFKNYSVRKLLIILNLGNIIFNLTTCIPNFWILFLSRFCVGLICGLARPFALNLVYTLSPPDLRAVSINMFAYCFPLGLLTSFILGL